MMFSEWPPEYYYALAAVLGVLIIYALYKPMD